MRIIGTAAAMLFAFVGTSTYANERVVFSCVGDRAVGYQAGSWTPNIFNDRTLVRVVDGGGGYWNAEVRYTDWQFVGSGKPEDEMWFVPGPSQAGRYFAMNIQNLRFSYTNTLGYLSPTVGGTAHTVIGTCRRGGG